MACIHAIEADVLGQGDHGRARVLIVSASKHRRLFAARRIADQCRGNGGERSDSLARLRCAVPGSPKDDDISDLLLCPVLPLHALHNQTAIDGSFNVGDARSP